MLVIGWFPLKTDRCLRLPDANGPVAVPGETLSGGPKTPYVSKKSVFLHSLSCGIEVVVDVGPQACVLRRRDVAT